MSLNWGVDAPARPQAVDPVPSELARRQAELVAALVAGGPVPAGFDAERVGAARRALLRKRAGEIAHAWPMLAAAFGTGWPRVVARFLDGRAPAGSLRDGWDVARALRASGELPWAAADELAAREAELRYDGASEPRRRRRLLRGWRHVARHIPGCDRTS